MKIPPGAEYCAYRHLSVMLDRTGVDWIIAVFEAYWDDAGTDSDSQTAIAACYVSTKRGWDDFVSEWDRIRGDEGFDYFHMTDFAAKPERGCKPFCDWDKEKRRRVYWRLAKTINENKWAGFGIAIPKALFDKTVPTLPERLQYKYGTHVFTFAFKSVLYILEGWRRAYDIKTPMRYVFDRMGKGSGEVSEVWKDHGGTLGEKLYQRLGIEPESVGGLSFEDKRYFKPLQAADILAWQLKDHMRNVILAGKHDADDCHPHFKMLRIDQHMRLAFMTPENFHTTINRDLETLAALDRMEK